MYYISFLLISSNYYGTKANSFYTFVNLPNQTKTIFREF